MPYMTRSDNYPPKEQYLAEGFNDMMEYILVDGDGIKGMYKFSPRTSGQFCY